LKNATLEAWKMLMYLHQIMALETTLLFKAHEKKEENSRCGKII
jgi:hypothetical protein